MFYQQAANEDNQCGICVDPADVAKVKVVCERIFKNGGEGQVMGQAERKADLENYTWDIEKSALLGLYQKLEKGVK